MNCSGHPMNAAVAKTIEGMNLYCEFNRAWIDMYLNSWRWMTPFAFYYYAKEQSQSKKG